MIMNNSLVMEIKAPVGPELDAALTRIVAQGGQDVELSSGKPLRLIGPTSFQKWDRSRATL